MPLPDFIVARVSYQMPASALANFGLSLITAVLTTMRSMISPGIFELSNTLWASGDFKIVETIGFQVTTAVTSAVLKAAAMSASDVLTTFRSFSCALMLSSARASR